MSEPETCALPLGFTDRMRRLLGAEYPAFLASYDKPRRPALRVNPLRLDGIPDGVRALLPFLAERVPFTADGWYYPDETWIGGHMSKEFVNYVNLSSAEVHKMGAHFKTLIGPYGTRDVIADDPYVRDLEGLDIDFVAYQDEIGVQKTKVEESAGFYEALKRVHDKAGRSKLWADVEAFQFEGEVYHSALLPAPFERLQKQLEAVSPYVEEILIYEYPGLFSKPGSSAFAGHPSAAKLYADYMNYRLEK